METVALEQPPHRREIAVIVMGWEAAFLRPVWMEPGKQTAGPGIGQKLVDHCKRGELAGKGVNERTARPQHPCTVCKECVVIAQMLDNRARHDKIHRRLADRKRRRRCVRDDLETEVRVEAQFVTGAVEADDEMSVRLVNKRKKRAFPAAADVDYDLPPSPVEPRGDFVLVERVQMPPE